MTKPLTPPDYERCQAEKPNGYSAFTLGGRPGRVRCDNKPTIIAIENEPGDDGQHGSMSLCADCADVFTKQMPAGYATFEDATSLRAAPRKALHNILDTMSGADGGESFAALRALIEQLDRQARVGDEDAAQVIDVVLAFSRLIDTAKREMENAR